MAARAPSVKRRVDTFEFEQFLILLGQGILRFREDADQILLHQFLHGGDDRQTADQFGNQTELQQIFGLDRGQDLADLLLGLARPPWRRSRWTCVPCPPFDHRVQTDKGAAADEEDIGGVDLHQFLLRMLAAALGRNRGHGPLDDLQQGLLHAFAGDIAGQRRAVGFAGDLVDLVDIDDAPLGLFDIIISGLEQIDQDILDIFADIAGLGQGGGIGHAEGHIEDPGQGLGHQGLAAEPVGPIRMIFDFCSST